MRILVIGGNGFIGTPLVRELRSDGHQVAVFHRRAHAGIDADGVTQIEGNRNRLPEYRKEFQQFKPNVIVDLVLSSEGQARQLMETAMGVTRRVVVASSMDVYRAWGMLHGIEPGALEPIPITEESPVRSTRQLYAPEHLAKMQGVFSWIDEGYDKIAVEEVVMNDADVVGTVVRLPMIYGPGDRLHRLHPVLKRIADGRPSLLLSDVSAAWRGPRGYVDNVAHAIALAATSKKSARRIYNVCEEPNLSELEWQKAIVEQMNWRGKIVTLPPERTPRHLLVPASLMQQVVVSSARIRKELGYKEIVERGEAIRRTVAWELQNPPETIDAKQFDYQAEDAAMEASG
jgi:nucleoside-diphosphate-sugar epimerase